MLVKVTKFFVLLALFAFFTGGYAHAQTCLSYKLAGDSSCQGGVSVTTLDDSTLLPVPEIEAQPVPVPQKQVKPKAPVMQAEPTLDDRIDDYMENYDKPPREFVAFNLEPTLENALKWAKKYREMMTRNQELTSAWGQAQTILNDMESKGQEVKGFQPMPAIPDYGAPLPAGFGGFAPKAAQKQTDNLQSIQTNSNIRHGAPTPGFSEGDSFLMDKQDDSINRSTKKLYGESVTASTAGPIEISYYFSAECPFCKKFEAGFKTLVKDFSGDLKVTCVDMTPSSRTRENIHGKIDCGWRAAMPGEAKAFGVQSTPTLIIDRGTGKGLEKIEGVVDMTKLESFLLGNI